MNPMKKYSIDEKKIWKEIKSNPVNDIAAIKDIELFLMRKRGHVFKMPPPGSPVIAFMSGGLDTTVVISILLKYYKVRVYSVFINRNLPHNRGIRRSISYFSSYFKKKYPGLFRDPFEISVNIPTPELKEVLSAHENDVIKDEVRKGIPLQPSIYALQAVHYAKYLEETEGTKIRTIVGAWLPSNSKWYGYESLTSLRSIMFNLCLTDNDFSWQFTSLPMERQLGFYFDKEVLVRIGNEQNLELDKTWTCFQGKKYQCGDCPPCGTRKDAFKSAGIKDPTLYEDGLTVVGRIKKNLKKFIMGIFFAKISQKI